MLSLSGRRPCEHSRRECEINPYVYKHMQLFKFSKCEINPCVHKHIQLFKFRECEINPYVFKLLYLPILFTVLLLGSCVANNAPDYTPIGLEAAVEDGTILYLQRAEEEMFETVDFILRDMSRTLGFSNIRFAFTSREMLFFERTGGYVDILVNNGDFVYKGDVLAILSFEDESMLMHKRNAEVRLEQFLRSSAETENRLIELIDETRENLDFATDSQLIELSLRLELAVIDLELFRIRRAEQVQELTYALTEIEEIMAGDKILAPFDGLILNTFQRGSFISGFPAIIDIADYRDFYVEAEPIGTVLLEMPEQMSQQALFRYGDVLLVRSQRMFTDEDGITRPIVEFYVRVSNDPWAAGFRHDLSYTLIPLDRQAFFDMVYEAGLSLQEGLSMLIDIRASVNMTPGIYSLPIGAVRQVDWATNYVRVLYNGVPSRRYVILGARDFRGGRYVQILSGIEPGMQAVIAR